MKSLLFTLLTLSQLSSFAFDDVCKLQNGQRVQISRENTGDQQPDDLMSAYTGTNQDKSEYVILLDGDLQLKTVTLAAKDSTGEEMVYTPYETVFYKPGRCYAARVSANFTENGNILVVSCMSTNANTFKTYALPLKCGY